MATESVGYTKTEEWAAGALSKCRLRTHTCISNRTPEAGPICEDA